MGPASTPLLLPRRLSGTSEGPLQSLSAVPRRLLPPTLCMCSVEVPGRGSRGSRTVLGGWSLRPAVPYSTNLPATAAIVCVHAHAHAHAHMSPHTHALPSPSTSLCCSPPSHPLPLPHSHTPTLSLPGHTHTHKPTPTPAPNPNHCRSLSCPLSYTLHSRCHSFSSSYHSSTIHPPSSCHRDASSSHRRRSLALIDEYDAPPPNAHLCPAAAVLSAFAFVHLIRAN
jgi:hypothetical protein